MKPWMKNIFLKVTSTILIFGSSSCALSTHQINNNLDHSTNSTNKRSTEIAKKSSISTGQAQHPSFKKHKKQPAEEDFLPGTGEKPPGHHKNVR